MSNQSPTAPKSVQQLRNMEKAGMDKMPAMPESSAGWDLTSPLSDPSQWMLNPRIFEQLWRVAVALSRSQMIPKAFQGKEEDCFIAVQLAISLKCQPLEVLRNTYIVHGNAGFSAKFAIALANSRGPFDGVIQFKEIGEPGKPSFGVTAFARIRATGQLVERTVTMDMATKEGWAKNNTKYQSIPEQMLAYRAATFLIRLYCPEVLMGMATDDELLDTRGRYVDGEVMHDAGETYPGPQQTVPYPADEADETGGGETDEQPAEVSKPEADEADETGGGETDEQEPEKKAAPATDEKKARQSSKGPTFKQAMDMIAISDPKDDDDLATIISIANSFKGEFHDRLIIAAADRFGIERVTKLTGKPLPNTGPQQQDIGME